MEVLREVPNVKSTDLLNDRAHVRRWSLCKKVLSEMFVPQLEKSIKEVNFVLQLKKCCLRMWLSSTGFGMKPSSTIILSPTKWWKTYKTQRKQLWQDKEK